ncbi:UNVERIFIED_CONTAM: hypothetical protein Sangu_2964800 [Sesamum angustifolium]|uniref:Arabinanase/levansucrase/invertase n=1 Tax=Sesamum angustifolium TaxID=2727405 RepID=A0AAW2IJU5_9LAMI
MEAKATPNAQQLTSKWPQMKPQFLNFTSSSTLLNPRCKSISLFVTHCSTKPNTNKRATDENQLNPEPIPSSRIQPTSGQQVSSSFSLSRGLIFDVGSKNSWDSLEIGSPVVKRYLSDEEERWYMWYHGRSSESPEFDSMGLAVSSNGIHWERGGGAVRSNADVGLVMSSSKDWWAFDTHSIRPCEVMIMSSAKVRANSAVYWLYYTGFSSENIKCLDNSLEFNFKNPERVQLDVENGGRNGGSGEILRSLPGLAMSQDGRHWARIEGEHHSGALLDVGSEGEWDSLFIASPQVVFMALEILECTITHLMSKTGTLPLALHGQGTGCVNARVLRNKKDGEYLMVYEGVDGDGKRSIGMAVSSDGLQHWRRVQDSPVLKQSEDGGWDCDGVGSPCLVQMDGDTEEWRLYYRGIGEGGRSGIGLAVSQGSEVNNFQRWTGFHL